MHVILDAGPLIYLAKLDALDVVAVGGRAAVVTPSVYAEAARPELAFLHPEVALVEHAHAQGQLMVIELDAHETELAQGLAARAGGLHSGELDVLALGLARGWPVCLHERQAARLARALGVTTIHVVELLFAGTPDPGLLTARIRHFARLTNLSMDDLDPLLILVQRRTQ